VSYGKIDPEAARDIFIRRALVERDWNTTHLFFAENGRLIEEAEKLEERTRRRDIVVDDSRIYEFYDKRIPASAVGAAHFDRWWKDERQRNPDLLTFPRSLLFAEEAEAALDPQKWPTGWRQGDQVLRLSYRFEPGDPGDGVTVHVPLTALAGLRPDGFEWLVPGLREELVTTLIRSLPKDLRRSLVPVPDVAREVLVRLRPRSEPLLGALARELGALRGVRVPPATWDLRALPPHLRMTYQVEDENGDTLAEGNDLDELRAAVRPRLRAELAEATGGLERHGLTTWTMDGLPRSVELHGVRAFPALVDEGESVGVRVLETPQAQAEEMLLGTRRLLLLNAPTGLQRYLREHLDGRAQLALAAGPHGDAAAELAEVIAAAADELIAAAGGPAWDAAGFERLRAQVAGSLADRALALADQVVRVLDLERSARAQLEGLTADAVRPARDDIARQLSGLIYPGFVVESGAARVADIERYLQAMLRRIERLPGAPAPDRDRMRVINELEAEWHRRLDDWPEATPLAPELGDVGWMLEELRVSQFAQGLGVRGPVSAKRIRKLLETA
jgi:ATP-dependent helicase HrpA